MSGRRSETRTLLRTALQAAQAVLGRKCKNSDDRNMELVLQNQFQRRRSSRRMGSIESKAGDVIASAESDDDFTEALRNNLQRLIIYAEAAPTDMQIKVAERLANEAVKRKRHRAEGSGAWDTKRRTRALWVSNTPASLPHVLRLSRSPALVHIHHYPSPPLVSPCHIQQFEISLANSHTPLYAPTFSCPPSPPPHPTPHAPHPSMSVPADRQVQIVDLGGLNLLLPLTRCDNTEVQRLSAHALANLSVNGALRRTRATSGPGGGGIIRVLVNTQ